MDRIQIPQTYERKSFIDPKPAWGFDKRGNFYIRCICGKCIGLHPEHKIDKEGNVNPSLHHDDKECGWHVHAQLIGFKEAIGVV